MTPAQLDFLACHTDRELAESLGVSAVSVAYHRRKQGLIKQRGQPKKYPLISKQELEEAFNSGKTEQAVGSELGISRQRVYQICQEVGVEVKKTPQWYANHWRMPQLGDKCWFEKELKELGGSISALARKINVSGCIIRKQVKRLGVDAKSFRRRAPRVELVCDFCGKEFIRRISVVKRNRFFFCNRICLGKWMANRSPRVSHWTPQDDSFLVEYYLELFDSKIAKLLGKKCDAVKRRRKKLGLYKIKRKVDAHAGNMLMAS